MSDELSLDFLRQLVLEQRSQIQDLTKKISAAMKQVEAAENYTRQDCLIFRGKLDIRPNLSLRDEMMRLIHFHTGVQFPAWCINTAHWMGGGHSIIVRFNNKAVKEQIYRNRVPKDQTKRGLFIHESLTSAKMELVSRCSALRKEGKISTYYTQGGAVFIKKSRDRPSVMITPDMSDADIILRLEKQPASFSQAAACPPSATQSAQVRAPLAPQVPPASVDQATSAVDSPSGLPSAVAAQDGGGADVGAPGVVDVREPQMMDQMVDQTNGQRTEGEADERSKGAADADVVADNAGAGPVVQNTAQRQEPAPGSPQPKEGEHIRGKKPGNVQKPGEALTVKGKSSVNKADNVKKCMSGKDSASSTSESESEDKMQSIRKDGEGVGVEPVGPQSLSSPSGTSQRKSRRKRQQTKNKW